jgi:glutaredoxin
MFAMDPFERKILAAFDLPGATGGSHAEGANRPRVLSLADLDDSAEAEEAVARLVDRGWLRPADAPDRFRRTEDGRLQLAAPLDVTIYSRPGCHLCEEAKAQIAPVLQEFNARLTEINIDEDPDLRARYDYDVPVIFLGARKAAKHSIDPVQFRRQLRAASVD